MIAHVQPRPAIVMLIVALGLALIGCAGSRPAVPGVDGADPLSADLLARFGLAASGPTMRQPITIGEDGPPWDLYLDASRDIGLDFAALEGLEVELRTTPIAGSNVADRVHVIVRDGKAVGAWLSSDSSAPGIFSLTGEP